MSREGIIVLFKLPLRQTTGMVASLLKMANLDWAVPDYTTLCRRQKTLVVQIPYRRADGPLNLLVDSTGIKFPGNGALSANAYIRLPGNKWQARKHGIQGRRQSLSPSRRVNTPARQRATVCLQTVRGGVRSIWPWIRRHQTSERWNSPPAAMVTALFCQNCSTRSPWAKKSAR